ncbi:unnamed protein product [Prorocentrum cordatum]|uniref:Uncharacterized protein n=1 Tax=Prorocentrum cordatum TaxID=2364126 RepID=A0ABN9XKF8_9DINO|nr:unnamed protein product [Polarella glacialis]
MSDLMAARLSGIWDRRWASLAAPLAPPLARSAHQEEGGPSVDRRNPRGPADLRKLMFVRISFLPDQAIMEASPPSAEKKSPGRQVPRVLTRVATELAGSFGRSEAGLSETRTEATDSTRDDQEDFDLSDVSVIRDLAGEASFSEDSE